MTSNNITVIKKFYKKLKTGTIMYQSYKRFSNEAYTVVIRNRMFQLTSKHSDLEFDFSQAALFVKIFNDSDLFDKNK